MSETAQKQRGIPFKKGQSGNPKGRPPGSYIDMFKQARETHGQAIVDAIVKAAVKGSPTAQRLVLERTEGLPVQSVEHTGTIELKVVHVNRPD